MYAVEDSNLLALAEGIDPERFEHTRKELRTSGSTLAVLLGTVFPPLHPRHDWQLASLDLIRNTGWSVQRQRQDHTAALGQRLMMGAGQPEEVSRCLRRYAWQEKARIALRELLPAALGGAGLTVTARELSELADSLLEVAVTHAALWTQERWGPPRRADGAPAELMVVGLGKLGGLELNTGSDVDIVFVYDTDEGGSRLTLHEHWTHVVRRALALMDATTADGRVWPVDLRLRPEGTQGPVANSLAASERYYETWGRLWERAAMLRARCCVGGGALWTSFGRDVLEPFVYRRNVDPSVARELAEMVERSRLELSPAPERDLKLGVGGIREAEFFVQSLQLIWGGADPNVRSPGTLAGLSRLRSRGLVTDREARAIADSYLLLRRVEHRVQWMSGAQTHLLPEGATDLDRLARSLGYENGGALVAHLTGAREGVAAMFRGLSPEAPRPQGQFQLLLARIDSAESVCDIKDQIKNVFGEGDVSEHLFAVARRPDGILGERARARSPDLVLAVLESIAGASDPEQAAAYLRALCGRVEAAHLFGTAFSQDPRAVRRFVNALGASIFVGDAVINHPHLSQLVLFGGLSAPDARRSVSGELELIPREACDAFERREAFVGALRRAKRRVTVELAVADLAGAVELRVVTRTLSDLADEILRHAVAYACDGDPTGLAVIAMGKLGGRDIGYGSDLDVIFIFDPEAAPGIEDPTSHFVRRAQSVIRLIATAHPEGAGYELDTRLRPSGAQGMLVTSLGGFARYHGVALQGGTVQSPAPVASRSSGAWERQVLLRARACVGDMKLGARVERVAAQAAYEQGAPPVEAMHHLRWRMERELGRETRDRKDLKTGRGGLLDIEFLAQWLQMAHGDDRSIRTTDTGTALDALRAGGYLEAGAHATLTDGYAFLRRLEQRIHVLRGAGTSVLDLRQAGLSQLARRMGFQRRGDASEEEVLLSHYRQVTEAVRATYSDVLGVVA